MNTNTVVKALVVVTLFGVLACSRQSTLQQPVPQQGVLAWNADQVTSITNDCVAEYSPPASQADATRHCQCIVKALQGIASYTDYVQDEEKYVQQLVASGQLDTCLNN